MEVNQWDEKDGGTQENVEAFVSKLDVKIWKIKPGFEQLKLQFNLLCVQRLHYFALFLFSFYFFSFLYFSRIEKMSFAFVMSFKRMRNNLSK